MDPHRGFHRRFLSKRRGLGEVLGGLLGGSLTPSSVSQGTTTSATPQNTGSPSGLGGVAGGLTSLVGDLTTLVLPSSGPSSAPSTSLTHSSSSSTGSTTAPAFSAQTAPSTASTRTSTTPTISTPTPSSAPSVSDTVYASSDGTRVVYITSTFPAASATGTHTTSFLQDPSLEGGIFALVGVVVLIIVFVVVTWTIRKRHRDRLERDLAVAVTFDPGATDRYERQEESIEKRRLSVGSSAHGHSYGYGMQPTYAPQQEYHGPVGYGHPVAVYPAPSPNLAPYQAASPVAAQPTGQGGANLTRKFSDRKPVPPLLPSPAYDPSNAHVSIPPQFYQQ